MPIGVDGVLIGAWTSTKGGRVLDVGTGCGVVALMVAQRDGDAVVKGIDVHNPSIEEASVNFENSPWRDRLTAECLSFCDLNEDGAYDVIVSNPPFYNAGVKDLDTARKMARHSGELSPEILVGRSYRMLTPCGILSMIVPSEMYDSLIAVADESGMALSRACFVKDHEGAPEKRVMLEFVKAGSSLRDGERGVVPVIGHLTMFGSGLEPTGEYRALCGQFYLKF